MKKTSHNLLFFLLVLAALSACQRKPSADETFNAEMARSNAETTRLESERLDLGFEAEVAGESEKVMKTAAMLVQYLGKEDASWFASEVAEVADPPKERTPAQRMQKAREVRARLEAELRRRR